VTRWFFAILLTVAAIITFAVIADMYHIYREINRNQAVIDRLMKEHAASEHRLRELEERIARIKNDRHAIEKMAFTKYRLLRSDQYVFYDPTD